MAFRRYWSNEIRAGLMTAALSAAALVGCSNSGDNSTVGVKPTEPAPPTMAINAHGGETAVVGTSAATAEAGKPDPLHQPFSEACTIEVSADAGISLPPTLSITGKNIGQLNEEVQHIWNDIKFVSADGKKQTFIVDLHLVQGTEEIGRIEILMQPDLAPNHVRNFVALTRLQFYDGLQIDRIIEQQAEGEPDSGKLVLLEAGSPAEHADPAASHLGYWLRPEFSETAKHVEGTVGACLTPSEDNAETAACRFYINLTPAPAMDGNFTAFGKVVKGLDVARRVASQAVRDREGGPDQGRPVTPIVIRSATVRAVPIVE